MWYQKVDIFVISFVIFQTDDFPSPQMPRWILIVAFHSIFLHINVTACERQLIGS